MRLRLWLLSVAASACTGPSTSVTVQESRGAVGGKVGVDLLVTDEAGAALACDRGSLQVAVSASHDGSTFESIDSDRVVVQCASGVADVAIVVDNSGSQQGHLDAQRAGAHQLIDSVLNAGGRASITRVSTNSSILTPLTTDRDALGVALDNMHISHGWTSLWDGIRLANQTLGGDDTGDIVDVGDVHQFCTTSRKLAVVAFTDGMENNSADQQAYNHITYPGDGIATTLADLSKLGVGHITTPIYTMGLGNHIDPVGLEAIASATGGTYHELSDVSQVETAFGDISSYFGSTRQVCTDLPWSVCGDVTIQTQWTWTDADGSVVSGTKQSNVHIPCEAARGPGREATIVVTMSNPGIEHETSSRLVANTVNWVTPTSNPKILVVLDDGHHNEFVGDAAYVRDLLVERHYDATLITERAGGITQDDVAGYDVVWFTNPGYPFDDLRSIDTLNSVLAAGGGVVVQGDDITQSMGGFNADVEKLTHLHFMDNGTSACGVPTDNDQNANVEVDLGTGHPLLDGIENATFFYGDDIDITTPTNTGEVILGQASLAGSDCAEGRGRPALAAFDPASVTTP